MHTDHTKAIRGLSIAVLVISILGIAGCIAGIIFGAVLWPAADSYISASGHNAPYLFDDDYGYGYSIDPHSVLSIGLGALIGIFIWGMIVSIVTLIVGILGMRNAGKPETYRPIFIWSIVGAVLSFFCGDIIVLVLLIIMAVFLNSDRNAASTPNAGYYSQPYGGAPYDPNYGYQSPQNTQGYGYAYPPQQPQQGYGSQPQPVQAQPGQPQPGAGDPSWSFTPQQPAYGDPAHVAQQQQAAPQPADQPAPHVAPQQSDAFAPSSEDNRPTQGV